MWAAIIDLWRTGLPRIISWVAGLWNSSDPTAEVKLLCYLLGVLAAIGLLTGALIAKHGEITSEWNTAFITFCSLIGGGAIVEAVKTVKGGK